MTWNALDCDQGPITSYILKYTAGNTSLTVTAYTTFYNLTELESCTNYSIRMAAVNEAGIGDFSESVSELTKSSGEPGILICCCFKYSVYTGTQP